jgi:hypothetical protein
LSTDVHMPKHDAPITGLVHQVPRLAHILNQRALKLHPRVQSSPTIDQATVGLGGRRLEARIAQPQKPGDVEFGSRIG